jgi:Polysaccharide lyase
VIWHGNTITPIATPYGTGMRYTAVGPNVQECVWDASTKCSYVKWYYPSDWLGKTYDWSFHIRLPSSGNPNGLAQTWHVNSFWEIGHPAVASGQVLAFDTTSFPGTIRFRFGVHLPPFTPSSYQFIHPPGAIQFDQWYKVRHRLKWSSGSDGFQNLWINDVLVVSRTGPNIAAGDTPPGLQPGWYGSDQLANQIDFSPIVGIRE